MAWFTEEFGSYFKNLQAHNDRDWFNDNKKRYEQHVKKPFQQFVADLILRMQAINPNCKIEPKDAIFRIHRDIRFSKDKTPYKTQMSAIIGEGGRKGMAEDGMYIEVGYNHLRVYGGVYMPDKDQLAAIRQEILYNQEEFKKVISDKKFVSIFGEIKGEKNKRLPAEFAEIQNEQPLIANKQFYYFAEIDPKLQLSDQLVDEMFEAYEASTAVRQFLIAPLKD